MGDPRGRLLRHDPRSREYPAETAPLRSVSWAMGPVLDQGDLGGCPGWCGATTVNGLTLVRDGRGAAMLDDRAGAAIYSGATIDDPFDGTWPRTDTGSSGLSAARAMKKLGLISRYTHAFGLDHALGALAKQPVMLGIPWPDSMMTPGRDGLLTVDQVDDGTPGHEITAFALDVAKQLVWLQNQWTPKWGIAGRAALRWADLGRLLDAQGDVTVPIL